MKVVKPPEILITGSRKPLVPHPRYYRTLHTTSQRDIDLAASYLDGAWRDVGDVVPTLAGMALYIGVNLGTLKRLADKCDALMSMCEYVQTLNHHAIINGGLAGHLNPAIVRAMMGTHGYSDKVDTTVTVDQAQPLAPAIFEGVAPERLNDSKTDDKPSRQAFKRKAIKLDA